MTTQEISAGILTLNSREEIDEVVRALKLRSSQLSANACMSYGEGDTVSFVHRGRTITGKVAKVNRTKLKIQTENIGNWSVPASVLTLVKKA